ncbi:MAG: hypothetical protein SGARI_006403, partial [Bacillariaceae sp.]
MVSSPFKKSRSGKRPSLDHRNISSEQKEVPVAAPPSTHHNSSSSHNRPRAASAASSADTGTGGGILKKHSSYKRKYGTKVEVTQGVYLQGDELEDYCRKRGLCPLCAHTKVRKKAFRLFQKNKWEPITKLNKDGTVYVVYKGFCVKPDCFTLEQAKRLAGDLKGDGKKIKGVLKSGSSSN